MTRPARASASSASRTSRAPRAPTPTRAPRARSTSTTSGSPRIRSTCETVAPATTATLDPAAPATGDTYDRAVKVNLSAADTGTNASGVENTEYRITTNGVAGEWTSKANTASESPFVNQVTVSSSGTHVVEFRSTDKRGQHGGDEVGHLQGPAAGLRPLGRVRRHGRSCRRWHPSHAQRRHAHHGPARADGLRRPASTCRRTTSSSTPPPPVPSMGPINFLGQDLPALGNNWTVETQFTARTRRRLAERRPGRVERRQQLRPLHADAQPQQPRDLTSRAPRTTRRRPRALAPRPAATATSWPTNTDPVTIKMRYTRVQRRQHRSGAVPDRRAGDRGDHRLGRVPGRGDVLDLNPSAAVPAVTPRARGSASSRRTTGPRAARSRPTAARPIAHVDYFRITPDNCPTGADQTAPTTTATAAPTAPNGTAGWYTSDVNVTLTGNDGANGSGVDRIEYKVDGGAFATYTAPIALTTTGTHTIEYRSIDKNNNVEATKTTTVKVDKAAPTSTATLEPATTPSLGPGHADARRDRSGRRLGRREARVPGQRGQPVRCPGARRRQRADWVDLRRGQQAGVHGPGRVLRRLPRDGCGRQRGDRQVGGLHDHRSEQRSHRSGDDADARPGRAGRGQDVLRLR